MKIAAYFEKKETVKLLTQLLNIYNQKKGLALSYDFYENEIDLLCDFIPGSYDALLIGDDINVSIVEEISKQDKFIRLIGVISFRQSTSGLESHLWYCIPSPPSELFLFPVLDRLISDISQKDDTGMIIKTKNSVLRLVFSEIEYVEVIGRNILFHLLGARQEEISGTFSDYEARLLQWPDFIKVHRAYIINLRHISKLTSEGILTSSGCWVPVSKHLYPQLKKDYLGSLLIPETKNIEVQQDTESDIKCEQVYTVLLIDDEESQRQHWSKILTEHGCIVRTADHVESALTLVEKDRYDCIILDVNLGNASGFDLCKELKKTTYAPIVYLSSLEDIQCQTKGFLTGGTDYITKNVTAELFWLKIQSRLKAAKALRAEIISGIMRLDLKERKAYLKEQELMLTAVEFDLLHLLMQNEGTAYPPNKLYQLIWGSRQWDNGHTVQLHLSQLCRKLENAYGNHSFIESVWGEGYRFVPEV